MTVWSPSVVQSWDSCHDYGICPWFSLGTHVMTVWNLPMVQSWDSCHDCMESAHGSVLGLMS